MSGDGDLRRLLPPPRRRPGVLAVLLRWRVELVLLGGLVAAWWYAGPTAVGVVAAMLGGLLVGVPPVRRIAVGLVQALIVPHRVRSGLVQAGVADRSGRPPWIIWARSRGDAVLVEVWLRSGTTPDDLRAAANVVAAAAGAAGVDVAHRSARQDRAVLVVQRPRWSWPGG